MKKIQKSSLVKRCMPVKIKSVINLRARAVTAVGIDYAEFPQRHCDDRPDTSMTWLFDRVGRGLYRLTPSQQGLADDGF